MERMFSVIGCQHGHIGSFIGEMIALGYSCKGIYESGDRKLAAGIAERYGVPFLDDMEEALAPEIGIVGSAALNNEKINIIELCESRGKHIMVDKPAVTCHDGLSRLEAVIGRGRIQIGMMLTERFRPVTVTLKQAIESGELGDIVSLSFRKPHRLAGGARAPLFFNKENNGGLIVDILVHDFDLLRWLTGKEVTSMQSVMTKTMMPEHPTFYDVAVAQVVMEDAALAQLYADWHTPDKSWTYGDSRLFVCGTKGSAELRLNGDPALAKEELMFTVTGREPLARKELQPVPHKLCEDFLGRIEGKPSVLTQHDVLMVSRLTVEADERAQLIDKTAAVV